MGIPKKSLLLLFAYLILSLKPNFAQIVFKELPKYEIKASDSLFLDISSKRKIISLNGLWSVYPSEDEEKQAVHVTVPSVFDGEGGLIFEKSFEISQIELNRHKMKLNFLGLNYTADISVNSVIIYRHSGGAFPFSLDLPKDIIHTDKKNILSVKLFYKLESENTIPVKQRFLFPQNFGGIIRDVYIHLIPNISISDIDITHNFNSGTNRAAVNVKSRIEHKEFRKPADTLNADNQFRLTISIIKPDGSDAVSPANISFMLQVNKEKLIDQNIEISSPVLWNPQTPQSYVVRFQLWQGETLIDASNRSLAVFSLTAGTDSLILNGESFLFRGVTYVPSNYDLGSLVSYSQMEKDIKLIKETGFNSIRFSKSVPHPYYLILCERYGLLSFIEIPINYIPRSLAKDQNFAARSRNFLSNFLKAYRVYSIAAVGLGGGYIPSFDSHRTMLHDLGGIAKEKSGSLVYASFAGVDLAAIENIDLYGIELFNKNAEDINAGLAEAKTAVGEGKIFISEATYIVNAGNTDGYVNEYSFEAQAKYFEGIMDFAAADSIAGYFLNSMFDYRGDFASLTGGFNEENLYKIGILGENRETGRLSYKVVFAKLQNAENVTIPIGSKNDESPMVFIIFGIILAILMGVLVNSGRKFREDSSRALLRPYNFFADVRDQRIMSGSHTTLLAIVVSAVSGLLLSNLLFYFKDSAAFEKLLLAFGSPALIRAVSYLSWNPLMSIIWLSILSLAALIFLVLLVKAASFFVRNRVYLSNSYFAVIWAFLPLVLLIPVGIILFRLLDAEIANVYVYILLILFTIWVFYRLMKGIYVIYDVPAGGVYLYSILLILLAAGGIILYYELNNSVIEYLFLTFNHYNIIG